MLLPKFKKLNNESGMVLFIVLMTSIVIMLFSLGILTQSLNEINYAQQQIDQITHDQEIKGAFWSGFATGNINSSGAQASGALNGQTVSGRAQTVTISPGTVQPNQAIKSYTITASSI